MDHIDMLFVCRGQAFAGTRCNDAMWEGAKAQADTQIAAGEKVTYVLIRDVDVVQSLAFQNYSMEQLCEAATEIYPPRSE